MLLVVLLACTSPSIVKGVVLNDLDGAPIAAVKVKVAGTSVSATTDAEGSYEIDLTELGVSQFTLRVEHDGMIAYELENIPVAEGATVPAESVRLFPKPPAPGLWWLRDAEYVEVKEPPESAKVALPFGGKRWGDRLPRYLLDVQSPVDLVLSTGSSGGEYLLGSMRFKRAHRDAFLRYPAMYESTGKRFTLAQEVLTATERRFRGDLNEGIYYIEKGEQLWFFEVGKAQPKVEDRDGLLGLSFPRTGIWPMDSAGWSSARDVLVSWCRGDASRCSNQIIQELVDAKAEGRVACRGRLQFAEKTVRFSSWQCNGGIEADFVEQGGMWVPNSIEREESGD